MAGPKSISLDSSSAKRGTLNNPGAPNSNPFDLGHQKYVSQVLRKNLLEIETVDSKHLPAYAVQLYTAMRDKDWDGASKILKENPEAKAARISIEGKTALHFAALFGHLDIVEKLVQLMSDEEVVTLDSKHLTALHEVTFTPLVEIARCLVQKNKNLVTIPSNYNLLPVSRALGAGREEMACYLYSVTPWDILAPENGDHGSTLLIKCYYSNMLDLALHLLNRCPRLAVTPDCNGSTLLQALASIPSAFPSGCQLPFWKRWIYKRIHIQQQPASGNNDISVNMPETNTSEGNAYFGVPIQQQPAYANNDIPVNMPETSTSKSDNMMSTCLGILRQLASDILNLLGMKNLYKTKLAHTQALDILRIASQEISFLNYEELLTIKVHKAILQATKRGIPEFIKEVVKVHTPFLWDCGERRLIPLFFFAVKCRQAQVFGLIYGTIWKQAIAYENRDTDSNTLLHMAGKLPPPKQLDHISGAALQMQRELQWFKEVESITPPMGKESLNKYKKTPREVFTKCHKNLVKDGEKWMKETAGLALL